MKAIYTLEYDGKSVEVTIDPLVLDKLNNEDTKEITRHTRELLELFKSAVNR